MNSSNEQLPQLTLAQAERQKQLKRFNLLTVYLPIALLGILIITVVGIMLWLTLFADSGSTLEWRQFSSATADILIIFAVLPMILFAAVLPISAAGWFWYTWQNRRPVESWMQKWLRKTDGFIESSAEKVESTSKKAADLSIQYRATTIRLGTIIDRFGNFIRSSRFKNRNIER